VKLRELFDALADADLDHMEWAALTVLTLRMHRQAATWQRSTRAIAADMRVSQRTAYRALKGLVDKGRVQSTVIPGYPPIWTLTPVTVAGVPLTQLPGRSATVTQTPDTVADLKEALEKQNNRASNGDGAGRRSAPASSPVENVHFAPGSGRLPNWSKGQR
jgi:hypothetical protein